MTRPFAPNFQAIGLSPIVAISERIRALAPAFEQGGERFAYLQRGELADPTPGFVVRATQQAVAAGWTRYPKAGGEPWFRDAVREHLAVEHGVRGLGRENVLCTYGGQEGLQLVFGLFAGGRVLSFAPTWSCVLENTFPYTEYELVTSDLLEVGGRLRVDWDDFERKLATVDVLYLNTPHNPTGKVFSRGEIERIDAACRRHGVLIVSDEAYKDFVFDGREHFSPLALGGDHIVGVFTCSKSFAATGFRIGYTVCRNAELIRRLTLGEYTQTAGVVPFIQKALAEALLDTAERPAWQAALRERLQRRRDRICERLAPLFDGSLYRPEGAFYLFPNLAGLVAPTADAGPVADGIVARFLEQGIAVVPGTAFGEARYEQHVRLSFSGVDDETLEAALERMLGGVLAGQRRAAG